MKKYIIYAFALVTSLSAFTLTSCKDTKGTDSTTPQEQSALQPDEAINRALRFYAGISKEGINIDEADAKAWDAYSAAVKNFMDRSQPTRKMVSDIAASDFSDFRDSIDYVFYPFSGADFTYPFTLFPNADTYFLCGIEKTGTPIDKDIVTSFGQYEIYRQALANYFRTSYFASKEMAADFNTMEIDGVCPVITMLMAISECQIISIKNKDIDEKGEIVSTADKRQLLEIKFCKAGSQQEQTVYYYSSNVADKAFDAHLKTYLDNTLSQHNIASYMKAAAFLLHHEAFSVMRSYILDHSKVIVQDDSGIPYRFFADNYNVTLYGEYSRPSAEFGADCYQADLEQRYLTDATNVKPLPQRIGYNNPSNLLVARHK